MEDLIVYEYKRGDFSVDVCIKNDDVVCFKNLTTPEGCSQDTVLEFVDMAERAILASLTEE